MIVTKTRQETIGIRQEDHAAFAAFILEQWNDHSLKHDEQRELIITAAREHDNGWREFDAAPRLDTKSRLPVDFKKITPEETYEIWMRGSQRFIDEDPYLALLITHHAYSLHEHTTNRTGIWKEFFVTLAQQRGRLRDSLGLTHNDIEHCYSYIRMADWLSLMFCCNPKLGAQRPATYAGYKVTRIDNTFRFRPYPFGGAHVRYELPVYPLEPKGYDDPKGLKKDLKKPQMREIVIMPLEL
jgi:hypothetical protein